MDDWMKTLQETLVFSMLDGILHAANRTDDHGNGEKPYDSSRDLCIFMEMHLGMDKPALPSKE